VHALHGPGKGDVDAIVEEIDPTLYRMHAAKKGQAVRRLTQIDVASQRRERSSSEARDSCNVNRGTDLIVDRLIKPAAVELKPCFIQRCGRERSDIARGDGLINILESAAATHRIETTHRSRIHRGKIVQAVPDRKLICLVYPMVDPTEEV